MAASDAARMAGEIDRQNGTPIYVHMLSDLLPNTAVYHVGDGIGAIHLAKQTQPLLEAWGTATIIDKYPDMKSQLPIPYQFNDLIVAAGILHPEITLTQIISSNDRVRPLTKELGAVVRQLNVKQPRPKLLDRGHQPKFQKFHLRLQCEVRPQHLQ